ncbi:peptidoglycan-binding domain-containing protein [Marinibacterium sp. SX1]|uniref:peptidoglycan-binding domain-containing protein n=1 Tax=Marinibacterium sp. SX1 TaxID=3388424 RepID=UPI003D17DAF1
MPSFRLTPALLGLWSLTACGPGQEGASDPPPPAELTRIAPPGAPPDTCWHRIVTPAVVETVTAHVLLQPTEVMADGTVTRPAIYKTETRQQIVREREETWFETPCPEDMTPEFIASLQRALRVRGFYIAPVTGQMDSATRNAVSRYQARDGLDSGILSLKSARDLGLVSVLPQQ